MPSTYKKPTLHTCPLHAQVASATKVRKMLQLVGNLGPACCLLYLALIPLKGQLLEAVVLLTVSMMTLGLQAGGFASTHTVRAGFGQRRWGHVVGQTTNPRSYSMMGFVCRCRTVVTPAVQHSW